MVNHRLKEALANASPRVQQAFLDHRCRESFEAFCMVAFRMLYPGRPLVLKPYLRAMIQQYERIAVGDLNRLVANVPPRHGKSEFGTCMLTAWILGRNPASKVMVVTYGLKLSKDLGNKIRKLVTHPHYQRMFPGTRIKRGDNRVDHFKTTAEGEFRAESQGSGITGLGTEFMVIDDFQMADDALSPVERENALRTFKNTLVSRFDNLGDGKILINQQRLHSDDLSGFALELGWPTLRLPAIAEEDSQHDLPGGKTWHRRKGELLDPDRCSLEFLNEQKLMQGPRFYNAQYQQNPGVPENSIIELGWFGQYDEMPPRRSLLKVIQSWDLAITENVHSDYSVGITCGFLDGEWYVLDIVRVKLTFGKLLERIEATHRQWRADGLVLERNSIGEAVYDQLKARSLPGKIVAPRSTISKLDRLAACTAMLSSGKFLLPTSAPWLRDFTRELITFPEGPHDDQVDAFSQLIQFAFDARRWVETRYDHRTGRVIERPRLARGRPRYLE